MSVISSDGKGRNGQVMEKLRTRKTPMRICNRRTRFSGDKKTQRRGGVIVTMSVEHSEGIALKTLEGVAEHHSRQISTTSTLFGPMGVSIGVVCESTTENKEVVMDVQQLPNDNTQSATDWTGSISHYGASLKSMSRPSICELRKSLSFLEDQQFEKLAEFNIETTQQLLNIPIRKFLEIEINGEQLQLLMSLLENAFCKDSDQPKSFQEEVKSFEEIAGDIEKFEANDDDDEKPLVIDETFSIIEENQDPTTDKEERSLNDIEECFAKIRNVKIPQSRATIDEVKSELSEIIAELDGKEKRLLRRLKDKKQTDEPLVSAMKSGTEEVVTTTSKAPLSTDDTQTSLAVTSETDKSIKEKRGQKTVKRRRNIKSKTNVNKSVKTFKNTDTSSIGGIIAVDAEASSATSGKSPDIVESLKTFDKTSQVTKYVKASSPDNANFLKLLNPPIFSGSRGIIFMNPTSRVILQNEVQCSNVLKPFKKRPQKPALNLNDNDSLLIDVSEPNFVNCLSERPFEVSNNTAVDDITLIRPDSDDTDTLSKEGTKCRLVQATKLLTPFSAASAQQNLQPTVLIKKLPTPLRKKQHDMDADSTTTGVDFAFLKIRKHENVADVGEAKKLRVNALQKKTRKRQAKVPNFVDNRDNKVPESSNISNEFLEVCSSDALDKVSQQSKAEEVHESQELKPVLKSVSPQSPLFESTPVKSEEFDESGIIMDTTITTQKEDNSERDNFSEGDLLATAPFSKTNENQIQCSTAKDSTNLSVTAQRRIEFDEKPNDKVSNLYDHYDADLIVTIDNTPLSPISGGITSPINSNNDYSPAMEIDGHCIGMIYLLKEIDMSGISVNKPDNLSMLLRTNGFDPRLSKYLKKEVNAVHTSTSICAFSKIAQSGDPRRTGSIYNTEKFSHQTPNMLIYGCLQRSPWYQSLMSTMKIQINQTISILVRAINNFQKIRLEDPYAVFDIFKLYCAGELLEILENLGLFVDVNGQITEKKNISTYAGRSYGCSSVVNATYSFIQPVEPSSVTVQHQQMRSFSSHAPNFSAMPFQPSASFQPPTPFISCYIESPHTPMENSVQMQQSRMRRPKPSQSRGPFEPPLPRRHCGLKVPYRNSAPPPLPSRSSLSPVKSIKPPTQSSNSDEECWDLDEEINSSTPSKLPLSPSSDDDSKQSRRNCTR